MSWPETTSAATVCEADAPLGIRVLVSAELVRYFAEGLKREGSSRQAEDELVEFLNMLLNDTLYPVASVRSGEREVTLSYRPRAFADPIF